MARDLITSWADYQTALDRLLAIATEKICVYDEDLVALKLDSPARLSALSRLFKAGRGNSLQIALRNAALVKINGPRLLTLLGTYSHLAEIRETPHQLSHLRDSMIVVDGKHALVRFDKDQPRSKLLIDEAEEVRPYLARFLQIWAEGGETVSGNPLGL